MNVEVDTGLLYPTSAGTSTSNMTNELFRNITNNPTSNTQSNTTSNITLAPSTFFSQVPTDQILALAGARQIKRPDAMLLLALFSHKRQSGVTEVRPSQGRLAVMLSCAVRTVQRGLARLEAAGLIAKRYVRDQRGRVHGLRYDLAAILALLSPSKATLVSHGALTRKSGAAAAIPSAQKAQAADSPKRQKCQPESESDDAEINNIVPGASPEPVSPAVAALANVGMIQRVAVALAAKAGEARCRAALDALAQRRNVKNKPAWLYQCLSENWDLTPNAGDARPPSHCRYQPPAAPSRRAPGTTDGVPDPLDALAPVHLTLLEAAARAELIAELPALRPVFERGRRTPPVTLRMRALLRASDGSGGVGEGV